MVGKLVHFSCLDRSDEDILAADSDIDVRQEPCEFKTPRTFNSVTFVKQTPGNADYPSHGHTRTDRKVHKHRQHTHIQTHTHHFFGLGPITMPRQREIHEKGEKIKFDLNSTLH